MRGGVTEDPPVRPPVLHPATMAHSHSEEELYALLEHTATVTQVVPVGRQGGSACSQLGII